MSGEKWFIEPHNMQAIRKITELFGGQTFVRIICLDKETSKEVTRELIELEPNQIACVELWLSRKADCVEFNVFLMTDNGPAKDYTDAVRKYVTRNELKMKDVSLVS